MSAVNFIKSCRKPENRNHKSVPLRAMKTFIKQKRDGGSDYVVSTEHPDRSPCNGLASKARGTRTILL